jgi:hypothetical protein
VGRSVFPEGAAVSARRRDVGDTVWLIFAERIPAAVRRGVIEEVSDTGYLISLSDATRVKRTKVWSTKRGAEHRLAVSHAYNARMDRAEAKREARKWERKAACAAKRLARADEERKALSPYAEVPR